jgi:methylated-DNA-protein-cysteine methyltransferase-like protein
MALSTTYARIYAVIRRIPKGRVATYGQVAALAGIAGRARQVGYALHALRPGAAVPWHRVLAAGGVISLAKLDPAAALTQRLRLEKEGVRFTRRGRADLRASGWKPGASAAKTPSPRAKRRQRATA